MEKGGSMKTYKITEKYVVQDTWIIEAEDETMAWNIAMTQDPDDVERGMKLSDDVEELK